MKKYKSLFKEGKVKTKWDREYQNLIKEFRIIVGKVDRYKQSALYGMDGEKFSISWHQPSTDWGMSWNFLGLIEMPGYKEKFDNTKELVINEQNKGRVSDITQRKNLEEFKQAIEYVKISS